MDSSHMDTCDRSRIVTILYHEVLRATHIVKETRHSALNARLEAQESLEKAVQRFTGFTVEGEVPSELS
jgi:hypothetical protein